LDAYEFDPGELSFDEDELKLNEEETEKERNIRIKGLKSERKAQLINEYMNFNDNFDIILDLIEKKTI
jgi:hypothetical protein